MKNSVLLTVAVLALYLGSLPLAYLSGAVKIERACPGGAITLRGRNRVLHETGRVLYFPIHSVSSSMAWPKWGLIYCMPF